MKNTSASYDELLASLAQTFDMALSFDENDSCDLLIGDETGLNIRRFEHEERLALTSVVAEDLAPDIDYATVLELLNRAINPLFEAGPAIGRDPETGVLIAYLSVPIGRIEPADFPQLVKKFLEFAIYYAEKLRNPEHFESSEVPVNPDTMLAV